MRSTYGRARQTNGGWGGVHLVHMHAGRMHRTVASEEGSSHVRRLKIPLSLPRPAGMRGAPIARRVFPGRPVSPARPRLATRRPLSAGPQCRVRRRWCALPPRTSAIRRQGQPLFPGRRRFRGALSHQGGGRAFDPAPARAPRRARRLPPGRGNRAELRHRAAGDERTHPVPRGALQSLY